MDNPAFPALIRPRLLIFSRIRDRPRSLEIYSFTPTDALGQKPAVRPG
jgi:hypothetical protein